MFICVFVHIFYDFCFKTIFLVWRNSEEVLFECLSKEKVAIKYPRTWTFCKDRQQNNQETKKQKATATDKEAEDQGLLAHWLTNEKSKVKSSEVRVAERIPHESVEEEFSKGMERYPPGHHW